MFFFKSQTIDFRQGLKNAIFFSSENSSVFAEEIHFRILLQIEIIIFGIFMIYGLNDVPRYVDN